MALSIGEFYLKHLEYDTGETEKFTILYELNELTFHYIAMYVGKLHTVGSEVLTTVRTKMAVFRVAAV